MLVLVFAVVATHQLFIAVEMPSQTIKIELMAAAADARRLPWTASRESVEQAVAAHFYGRAASVDASAFPTYLRVTLPHLDAVTCVDVVRRAHRIEGSVVVALDGYAVVEDCRDENDMTWRIMP
jgi:hypothetical protein